MYVLVAYDVATKTVSGERRLRRVAKTCVQYGQRVQNSLFECSVDPGQYELLKHELLKEIDMEHDSLRFYNLGRNWHNRLEQFGSKRSYDPEGFLCF